MKIKKLAVLMLAFIMLSGAIFSISAPSVSAAETDEEDTLPSSFSTDYNNMLYSTEAKDQYSYGLCWAFSAVACAEADAIKNHGANREAIDLSEWHLAYFAYYGERAGTGDSVYLDGNTPYYYLGGFDVIAALTLSSGIGFANEAVAPFNTFIIEPSLMLPDEKMYLSDYRIENVILLDIAEDTEAVKHAVYEYGAVAVSYHSDTAYMNYYEYMPAFSTYAQYCSDTSKVADHSVTIVGWDDNYSRFNFKQGNCPSNNGAWLVKNSWGSDWGLNGYFWISYEDVTLTGGAAFDVTPTRSYDTLYQHDGGVSMLYVSMTNGSGEAANIFTAGESDELLCSVGVAAIDIGKTREYTLKIYGEPEYTSSGGFTYRRLIHTQTGLLHEGYNTVILDSEVELPAGKSFAVSLSADMGLMVDADSETEMTDGAKYVSDATVKRGQTVYNEGDGKWADAYEDDTPWNARIKAYTITLGDRTTPVTDATAPDVQLKEGQTLSEALLSIPAVLDPDTDKEIAGVWSYADDTVTPSDGDIIELFFTPDNIMRYKTISLSVKVRVEQIADGTGGEVDSADTGIGIIGGEDDIFGDGIFFGDLTYASLAIAAVIILIVAIVAIAAVVLVVALAVGIAAAVALIIRRKRNKQNK
ncbi:MAG: hypothetical protein IJ011_06215 [Clostridia bacterium]|nr:hypothetical protein [Clostridia bacterium]